MSDALFDRFLVTMAGSLAGFLLGLVAMQVKEGRDDRKRLRVFAASFEQIAWLLHDVLHEEPKEAGWLKVDGLLGTIDVLDDRGPLRTDFAAFMKIYGQWSRGFFLPSGIKAKDRISVKAELSEIAGRAGQSRDVLRKSVFQMGPGAW